MIEDRPQLSFCLRSSPRSPQPGLAKGNMDQEKLPAPCADFDCTIWLEKRRRMACSHQAGDRLTNPGLDQHLTLRIEDFASGAVGKIESIRDSSFAAADSGQ